MPAGANELEFSLSLVTIDYYLAKPVPGLDVTHSLFHAGPVDRVRTPRRLVCPFFYILGTHEPCARQIPSRSNQTAAHTVQPVHAVVRLERDIKIPLVASIATSSCLLVPVPCHKVCLLAPSPPSPPKRRVFATSDECISAPPPRPRPPPPHPPGPRG
jgi:hypothetical protein